MTDTLTNWIPTLAKKFNVPSAAMHIACQREAALAEIPWSMDMPAGDIAAIRAAIEQRWIDR
ncbi:hypothetical protein [Prescottella equi]